MMTKIMLYDKENDVTVEGYVSDVDAARAYEDPDFAAQVFKSLQQEQNSTLENTIVNSDLQESDADFQAGPSNIEATATSVQENDAVFYRWTTPTILLLLETYKLKEEALLSGKTSQKKVWEEVSNVMSQNGYIVTGPQCYSKLRSLKKTYKSIKDHNNKSGNNRKNWEFFQIMDEIFSKKAWCNPVAVASSTGLSMQQPQAGDSNSRFLSSSSKTTITSLLEKRIQQREEHENNKRKRHEERMEMDKNILNVLEKLLHKK